MESDKQDFSKPSKTKYVIEKGLTVFTKKTGYLVEKGVKKSIKIVDNAAEFVRNWLKSGNSQYHPKHHLKSEAIQNIKYFKGIRRTISPIFIDNKETKLKGIGGSRNKTIRRLVEFGKNLSRKERELVIHGLVLSALIIPMATAPLFSNVAERLGDTSGQKIIKAQEQRQAMPSRGSRRESQNPAPLAPPAPTPAPAPAPAPPAPDPNLPPVLTDNTQNLNPVLLSRFDAFRTYIFQQYGVVLEIKSGWRSTEEQAELFRTLPPGQANPPGVSLHEKGLAIDYTPFSATYNRHLNMFGLKLPYPGKENWHIEPV